MIKAKRVAHDCVATLFYFAQIQNSNPNDTRLSAAERIKTKKTFMLSLA